MRKGFTLIELMVLVAIISIIGVIAVPKLSLMVLKTKEKANITNLNIIRESLRLYYAGNAEYPSDLNSLYPKYISKIPELSIPNTEHEKTSMVRIAYSTYDITDSGMWAYVAISTSSDFGYVFIDCDHTDSSGKRYCDY